MKAPKELVVAKENVNCKEFILFLKYLLGRKMLVGADVPSLIVGGRGSFWKGCFHFFSFAL